MTHASPLPSTPRDIPSETDDYGNPWAEYVRSIEFVDDQPPAASHAPIHGLSRILFDGVMCPARVLEDGITIDVARGDATVVTMHVHRDDVQIGRIEDGEYIPHLIGGRRVCTPLGDGWAWVPVDDESEFVVCAFYVASIIIK